MQHKLYARLIENPTAFLIFEADFDRDWVTASEVCERAKRELLYELRQSLHKKIACLSLDDVSFMMADAAKKV